MQQRTNKATTRVIRTPGKHAHIGTIVTIGEQRFLHVKAGKIEGMVAVEDLIELMTAPMPNVADSVS